MRRRIAQLKNFGYIFWHARHMVYHILLGAVFVVFLDQKLRIGVFSFLFVSVIGSLVPDTEHLLFFLTFGKKDAYTSWVRAYIKNRDWRILVRFLEKGHKYNTTLRFHNVYTVVFCTACSAVLYQFGYLHTFVFFGAATIHYVFDMLDDVVNLGRLNKNWFRWGRGRAVVDGNIWKQLDRAIRSSRRRRP